MLASGVSTEPLLPQRLRWRPVEDISYCGMEVNSASQVPWPSTAIIHYPCAEPWRVGMGRNPGSTEKDQELEDALGKNLSLWWVSMERELTSITYVVYKKLRSFVNFLRYSKNLISLLYWWTLCMLLPFCFVYQLHVCFLRGTCLITIRQTSQYFFMHWKLWDLAKYSCLPQNLLIF